MRRWLEAIWWHRAAPPWPLRLLAAGYAAVADARARHRQQRATRLPVPVIVVGNIAVGGTGKTPVTLALIEMLRALGAVPGVISRGYGGAGPFPLRVTADTPAAAAGDEPVLIAQRSGVPVCVAPSRVAAGRALLAAHPEVTVLLCDDGLQHVALARDLELCVIDGQRGHGNGYRLPAGPLREPIARAAACDLVLVNGADAAAFGTRALRFDLVGDQAVPLRGGAPRPLTAFAGLEVHAVAGIGHPQRFFDQLAARGLRVRAQAFADHHAFTADDFRFDPALPVMMTEKDAVKCRSLMLPEALALWVVPVVARFSQDAHSAVQECLRATLERAQSAP